MDFTKLGDVVLNAIDYLKKARSAVDRGLEIPPPWEYDPSDHLVDGEIEKFAMKWTVENAKQLQESNDGELEALGERMEQAIDALISEVEDENVDVYHESLFLLLSTHDGLVSWLCKTYDDDEIRPSYPNESGEAVYFNPQKRTAVKKAFTDYLLLDSRDEDEVKTTWNQFWQHRHRIMHGHPNAHFNIELAITAQFFLGVVSLVVLWRQNVIDEEE